MPKIYFMKKELAMPQGAKVHVRYSYGAVFQQGGGDKKLTAGISEGIEALNHTVTYLKDTDTNNLNKNFKRYFEKYFLSENYTDMDMLNTIYAVLLLTKNGVANTTVKVFSGCDGDKAGLVIGYVASSKNSTKSHHTGGTRMENGQTVVVSKGDIHMGVNAVLKGTDLNNAVLFVHEATHKYAGTADFGEKGYTTDNGSYRQNGLTTTEALMNAESYGRFAVHFYRAEKGMRQW